jgi:hypothetical protein
MLSMGTREMALAKTEGTRFKTFLTKPRDLTAKGKAAKLVRSADRYAKTLQGRIERFGTIKLWQVVTLVTCVEAYLQDLLSAAASVDPELMSRSQQLAPYADVIAATSLEQLANELRARWARGWLNDGGPTRWISRFERMGARGYPDDLAACLERIWGIRHVVVHAAGIATPEFVKRHPGIVAAAGDRLLPKNVDFKAFLEAVKGLVEPTEQFFLARYPSLIAVTSAGPAKNEPTLSHGDEPPNRGSQPTPREGAAEP